MSFTDADRQAMDDAAVDAENDLTSLYGGSEPIYPEKHIITVANWWAKWVMKAGHKRLGRILLQYKSKVKEE